MTQPSCNCVEEFDNKLREHNTRIDVTFDFPRDGSPAFTRPKIATSKIKTRKRCGPAIAIPSFCPFCGTRYVDEPAQPATSTEGGVA